MKRIILILALFTIVGPLGGCQAFKAIQAAQGFTVTQGQLDGAQNTYDGTALATLKTYATLPRCAKGTALSITNRCHDAALLKKMRNADATVASAFAKTQDQITSGNNSGAAAAWNTLQIAIAAMQKIISDNNLTGI